MNKLETRTFKDPAKGLDETWVSVRLDAWTQMEKENNTLDALVIKLQNENRMLREENEKLRWPHGKVEGAHNGG